ncbi:uncharacterized protein LOC132555500 [Ylistrum balloti]|uniref:uncharacterized protein LOC132555500 n=1 Tax=Ylistrum balloti TaxID=509963 RepID=UPI002905ABD2|nr:uncharacterized protein LOC132555500 [Ylistrum balloti]
MMTKWIILCCVALLGLDICVQAEAKSRKGCDVGAGMKRRAKIPASCNEGVISFDYPWLHDKERSLIINANRPSDDFVLCIYSCTEDVLINGEQNVLKKGETWCLKNGQKATIKKSSVTMPYGVLFRYLDKANLKAFQDRPIKSCRMMTRRIAI